MLTEGAWHLLMQRGPARCSMNVKDKNSSISHTQITHAQWRIDVHHPHPWPITLALDLLATQPRICPTSKTSEARACPANICPSIPHTVAAAPGVAALVLKAHKARIPHDHMSALGPDAPNSSASRTMPAGPALWQPCTQTPVHLTAPRSGTQLRCRQQGCRRR